MGPPPPPPENIAVALTAMMSSMRHTTYGFPTHGLTCCFLACQSVPVQSCVCPSQDDHGLHATFASLHGLDPSMQEQGTQMEEVDTPNVVKNLVSLSTIGVRPFCRAPPNAACFWQYHDPRYGTILSKLDRNSSTSRCLLSSLYLIANGKPPTNSQVVNQMFAAALLCPEMKVPLGCLSRPLQLYSYKVASEQDVWIADMECLPGAQKA